QQWVLVLTGAVLGAAIGLAFPEVATGLKPFGDIFIALIKMTIAPLIFLVVVTGIAQVGDMRAVGRIGLKAFVYFEGITTLCLGLSLLVAQYIHPGAGVARPTAIQAQATAQYASVHMTSLSTYLVHMVPETFVGAFAAGDVLQVLVLAVLAGFALLMMGERGVPLRVGLDHITRLVFGIVHIVVLLAPIGAFGAMAFTVGKFGFSTLTALLLLVGTAWLMMAFFVLVVLTVVTQAAGVRLWDVIALLRTELLVVIGTSSSETAIPGMMEKLSDAGVGRAVAGLVIPSGYSFNLDGVALTLPLSVLFIAQVYGVPMSFEQQLSLMVVMLFTSKGAAGVTGGAFAALAATVMAAGLPLEGLALLLGIDRFMSLGRAVVNTIGNAVAAIIVARWDGDFDSAAWAKAIDRRRIAAHSPPQTASRLAS
ncbi:MAG: cation:dicarboxylate symporter family transporter, partial [Janthinobacterium lividum]